MSLLCLDRRPDHLGTWAPAHPLMDPTQRLRPGPSGPWSSPEEDDWPECPDRVRDKRFSEVFHVPSHQLPSFRPFETFKGPRHVHFLRSLGLGSEGSLCVSAGLLIGSSLAHKGVSDEEERACGICALCSVLTL